MQLPHRSGNHLLLAPSVAFIRIVTPPRLERNRCSQISCLDIPDLPIQGDLKPENEKTGKFLGDRTARRISRACRIEAELRAGTRTYTGSAWRYRTGRRPCGWRNPFALK